MPLSIQELLNAVGDGEGGGGSREDYSAEDVEYYFNYSGILAERGSYDQLEDLLECECFFPMHASCTTLDALMVAHHGLQHAKHREMQCNTCCHDACIQSCLLC